MNLLFHATCGWKLSLCVWTCSAHRVWLRRTCSTVSLFWRCRSFTLNYLECEWGTSTRSSLLMKALVHLWTGRGAGFSRSRWGTPCTWAFWQTTRDDTPRRCRCALTCAGCLCSSVSTNLMARLCCTVSSLLKWVAALDIHIKTQYSIHGRICALYRVRMPRESKLLITLRRAEIHWKVWRATAETWRSKTGSGIRPLPGSWRFLGVAEFWPRSTADLKRLERPWDDHCLCLLRSKADLPLSSPPFHSLSCLLSSIMASMSASWSLPGESFLRGNPLAVLTGHPVR